MARKTKAADTVSRAARASAIEVRISVGSYRFLVSDRAFRRWERGLQNAAGFGREGLLAEIRRRLAL